MSPRQARAITGRAGDDPAAALREHLIDAAERLLARSPITSITTRDIARAADVSDGVLYNYFADKNALLVAAVLREYRSLVGRYLASMPAAGTATVEANLVGLGCGVFELAGEVVPMIAGLISDPVLFHRVFEDLHREPAGPHLLREPLAAYLAEEQQLGRVAPGADLDAASMLLLGSASVLALTAHVTGGGGAPPRDQVRPIVETLMQGLRPRAEGSGQGS
jgi:AcrR family transcriptional regulator